MCGILGFIASNRSRFDLKDLRPLMDRLLLLSESRGKEASGLAISAGTQISILKRPVRAATLIRSFEYQTLFNKIGRTGPGKHTDALVAMGHTRMVTNGSAKYHENNQPVFKHGMLCFHNGIVVNDNALWNRYFGTARKCEVDTEVILSLVAQFRQQKKSLTAAVQSTFELLEGANSLALLAEDKDSVILASTNGSLFAAPSVSGMEFIYASEKYFLEKSRKHPAIKHLFAGAKIVQVKPNTGYVVALESLQVTHFKLRDDNSDLPELPNRNPSRHILDLQPAARKNHRSNIGSLRSARKKILEAEAIEPIDEGAIASLRRCSKCLLPQTFPMIDFDESGRCNYCQNHKTAVHHGKQKLLQHICPPRKSNGEPDCLVPLSGGRDSSYALHYVTKVLKMKPVAYTYDWGMVTDLARRNISRMCGELEVEHILISADIRKKRENIRKNVNAWLRRPDLGTIPLFMAGDKQFFYYAGVLAKQMKISTTLFSMNPLERTDFKSAFCGIQVTNKKKMFWDLSGFNKLRLLFYYSGKVLRNPAYLNSSIADSLRAYLSYYFLPKSFTLFYDYIAWDETVISETLTQQYGWEKASDRESTWRIGDGTAAFYNYIYYHVAGFTENDTFRSNQIRQGQITREEALAKVKEENRPRFESIRWYCDTVGIDWREALLRINAIPPLYSTS